MPINNPPPPDPPPIIREASDKVKQEHEKQELIRDTIGGIADMLGRKKRDDDD